MVSSELSSSTAAFLITRIGLKAAYALTPVVTTARRVDLPSKTFIRYFAFVLHISVLLLSRPFTDAPSLRSLPRSSK